MPPLHHLGLYIHIPVCQKKCSYCDFYSLETGESGEAQNILSTGTILPNPASPFNDGFWSRYLQDLKSDLGFFLPYLSADARLGSIFLGGGTPSLAPPEFIAELLEYIFTVFSLDEAEDSNNNSNRPMTNRQSHLPSNHPKPKRSRHVEITLEANPEQVNPAWLRRMRKAKVNRISMGLQSNTPKLLCYLQRQTTREQNLSALEALHQSSFTNYSTDILYGIEGQSNDDITTTLQAAVDAQVSHISAYALTAEPNTPFYATLQQRFLSKEVGTGSGAGVSIHKGKSLLQEFLDRRQEQALRQEQHIAAYLQARGFEHYEVSNYARKGARCRHNLGYWQYRPYIGIGAAAHAFLYTKRYAWPRSLGQYQALSRTLRKPQEEEADATDALIGMLRLHSPQSSLYLRQAWHRQGQGQLLPRFKDWLQEQGSLVEIEKTAKAKGIKEAADPDPNVKNFRFRFSPEAVNFADSHILQAITFLTGR